MISIREVMQSGSKLLARRVDQLCANLENLSSRVRDAVATAIGETLSGIIRDAAMHVLAEVVQHLPGSEESPNQQRYAPGHTAPRRYESEEYGYWADEDDDVDDAPAVVEHPVKIKPDRLRSALAAGLRVASWWLRRSSRPRRGWSSVAAGLIATTIAFFGGPIVVAVLGLAESAQQFSVFAEAVEHSRTLPSGMH